MWIPHTLVLLISLLATAQAGEYCDDFEQSGDFGTFWKQISLDSVGQWKPTSYKEISQKITDFPEPASGDTILYLTLPEQGTTTSARMETNNSYRFPSGSSISFRYWLRTQYENAGTLYVRLAVDTDEREMIIDLSSKSGPNNADWKEASAPIEASADEEYQILFFASTGNDPLDNIALDDITISGPDGLPSHPCGLITTTTTVATTESTTQVTTTAPPFTTTEPDTTFQPTTTELTTHHHPTTAESTSARTATVTEPPTAPGPTTSMPPATTDGSAPTAQPGPYGPSELLWVVFAVLGTSLVLLLVLALLRRHISDRQPLMQEADSSSSFKASRFGWFDYVTSDPWRPVQRRL